MVSNDLVDGFIPRSAVKLCNLCRKKSMTRPFTCEVYPDWIPDEMLTRAEEKKRMQREQGSAAD